MIKYTTGFYESNGVTYRFSALADEYPTKDSVKEALDKLVAEIKLGMR